MPRQGVFTKFIWTFVIKSLQFSLLKGLLLSTKANRFYITTTHFQKASKPFLDLLTIGNLETHKTGFRGFNALRVMGGSNL